MIQQNIQRVAIAPVRPIRQFDVPRINVTLSASPRTLYDLWDEFNHGIGGQKPAKDFTPRERGMVKHKYSRQKVVWDTVARLVNSGLTSHVSID